MRTKQFAGFLKQFMKNSDTPLPALAELPHNLSVLHAGDLIWLHRIEFMEQCIQKRKINYQCQFKNVKMLVKYSTNFKILKH